eukprot:4302957-Pleurochrysis_carterae.AAC.1
MIRHLIAWAHARHARMGTCALASPRARRSSAGAHAARAMTHLRRALRSRLCCLAGEERNSDVTRVRNA